MRASAPSRAVPLGGAVGERGAAQTLAFPLGWGCRAFNQTLGGGLRSSACAPRAALGLKAGKRCPGREVSVPARCGAFSG